VKPSPNGLFAQRDFRWLIAGGAMSVLGDQFTLIALPWLVLQLSGKASTLGLVIALMSLPRAILIPFGGAVTDRYAPKRVLMLTKYANAVLLGALATLVLSGSATLGPVTVIAALIGVASAFSIPAGTSILPHVAAPEHLRQANGVMMGLRQLSLLAGPLLAALLFAVAGDGSGAGGANGLGIAFALDCASFVLSAWTLAKVRLRPAPCVPAAPILAAVRAGLALVWNDVAMRTCFGYWALCTCVTGGLMQVALPVLASTRLQGASSLGLLLGAHGAGSLAGMALASISGNLRLRNLGTTLLVVDAIVALLVLPMAQLTQTWQIIPINLAVGVLSGFMQVAVFTWIQQRVPAAMLGRTMSIFMFILMGLAPLTAGITGWIMQATGLASVFIGAGILLALAAALAYAFTPMRHMTDAPAAQGA
jgi:MFS family permease